ncbi:M48 family metallopeptidase [Actinocrinis puniceicyclus]|uniref:M48 family metallopeptidase n=1 Tax=Actinocrinis puniceicyclus TaxID=977794 RepID=A0A8J7WLF1_9ACTN|nr:M48 family metallopeptidase [Actinocrinis puniceicyclus]MBS2961654.1 M48 family metallopeptidase [Actinocrinis puniceicyclus]
MTTQALLRDFTERQIERSRRRKRAVLPLRLASAATGFAAVCVLAFTPLGADLVRGAGSLAGGGWIAQALLGAVALDLALTLVGLPAGARMESVNRRWRLSNRSWRLFWADTAKGLLIGALLLASASLGLFALIRALPGTWWIAAAAAAAALVFVLSFLVPVVFEPLFNRFRPLEAGPLRERLLHVAARSGVAVRDIMVSDASRRTNAMNAYVSGMGRTRRIVVWDTTLTQGEPDEVAAITAHELGHAARRDVPTGTALGALGMIAGTLLLAGALHWRALLEAAGTPGAADPRTLPLIIGIAAVFSTFSAPLFNAHSRRIEARADEYALNLTRNPAAVVSAWRTLAVQSISDLEPHPLAQLWLGTHPAIPARIAHARGWAAAHGVPVALPDPGAAAHPRSDDDQHEHEAADGRPDG